MGSGISSPTHETSRPNSAASTASNKASSDEKEAANATSSTSTISGCPMKQSDGSYSYDWNALWKSPHRPGGSKPLQEARQEYNVYSQPINSTNQMPSTPNQLPAPNQQKPLSKDRVPSSIPKGGAPSETVTWTYPSPQMFYNALVRKHKLGDTTEEDMESIVALHNAMNEKTWQQVCAWETLAGNNPKLLKFQGRPHDLSPKAALKHYLLGHPLPYDRHDWTVLRDDGTTARYVIDYYHDDALARHDAASAVPALRDETPSLLVDVRPALDGVGALWQRIVQMPVARSRQSTKFVPLPLRPSDSMKSQVEESIQVWNSIQHPQQQQQEQSLTSISWDQAKQLALQQARIRHDCATAARRLDVCRTESECAQASMDWTLCTGRIVCGLQHEQLVQSLQEVNDTTTIDAAVERLSDCVAVQSQQQAIAKAQHPKAFSSLQ